MPPIAPNHWKMDLPGRGEKLEDSIRYMASKLRFLYPTKLVKMLYLAEVDRILHTGDTMTGARFKSDHYGPNSPQATACLVSLQDGDLVAEPSRSTRGHDMTFVRAARTLRYDSLDADDRASLDRIINHWGYAQTDALVTASKQTLPYKNTAKRDWIDLPKFAEQCHALLLAGLDPTKTKDLEKEADDAPGFDTIEEFKAYLDS